MQQGHWDSDANFATLCLDLETFQRPFVNLNCPKRIITNSAMICSGILATLRSNKVWGFSQAAKVLYIYIYIHIKFCFVWLVLLLDNQLVKLWYVIKTKLTTNDFTIMPLKFCSLISDKSRAQLLEAEIKKPQMNTKRWDELIEGLVWLLQLPSFNRN